MDTQSYFVSESSIYHLLKAADLIASPAVGTAISARDEPRVERRADEGRAGSLRKRGSVSFHN